MKRGQQSYNIGIEIANILRLDLDEKRTATLTYYFINFVFCKLDLDEKRTATNLRLSMRVNIGSLDLDEKRTATKLKIPLSNNA